MWDNCSVLETLQSLHWIAQRQPGTPAAVPLPFSRLIEEVHNLIKEDWSRFAGNKQLDDFQSEIEEAVEALAKLGCQCTVCNECCPCRANDGGCVTWCKEHASFRGYVCMERSYDDLVDTTRKLGSEHHIAKPSKRQRH